MKHLLFVLTMLTFVFILPSCTWVKPEFEGILMTNCGKNGIEDFKKVTGKVNTVGICKELILIPMYEQTGDVEPQEIMAKDGGTFTVDPSYTYNAIRGQGRQIALTYRQFDGSESFLDAIEENILNRRIVNLYREAARNFTTDSLMRNLNLFESQIEQRAKLEFEGAFFNLKELTSGLKPPPSLRKAIEQRNAVVLEGEKMRQQMEKEQAQLAIELEKAKVQIEIAKAEAEANLERAKGLTDEVLREMAIKGWIKNGCPIPQAVGETWMYDVIQK